MTTAWQRKLWSILSDSETASIEELESRMKDFRAKYSVKPMDLLEAIKAIGQHLQKEQDGKGSTIQATPEAV